MIFLDLKGDIEQKADEEQCFDELLNIRIEVSNKEGRSKLSVGSALELFLVRHQEKPYQSQRDEYPGVTQTTIKK